MDRKKRMHAWDKFKDKFKDDNNQTKANCTGVLIMIIIEMMMRDINKHVLGG